MPYIGRASRPQYGTAKGAVSPGELNYVITREVDEYIHRFGSSYATINAAIGVLECAKLELYRRIAAPYEDEKLALNGDVYRGG